MNFDDDGRLVIGSGVQLKPYKPRPFLPREYITENEIRQQPGGDLILDAELYPNYAMFGFKHVASGKYLRLDGDFNPHFLSWLIFSFRTIGFNSLPFDLPIVWAAYVNRNPSFLKRVADALIREGKPAREVAKEYGFDLYTSKLQMLQHVDLINVCPLKGSLKLYGARLHSKRIQELPFPDDEYLVDWQIPVVQEYNCNDLDVTHQVADFCKERLELRESISREYNLDLMSKSDAQMAEAVISKEVSRIAKKYIRPPEIEPGTVFKYKPPAYLRYATPQMQMALERVKKANFILGHNYKIISPPELEEKVKLGDKYYSLGIGGLHSVDKSRGYEAKNGKKLKDIDVTSYYPNAIINMRLIPIAMGEPFLIVYSGFKDQRVAAKRNKQFTKDKGLKIFLNGVSGKFSDQFSTMYSPGNTIQMNLTGQLSILMLAEMFICQGMEVVSANTDGLVVYYDEGDEEKVNYWYHYWEKETGFNLEHVDYSKYYARDVNNYVALKSDNSIKKKGVFSEVGSQSGTQLDTNPANLICSDAIEELLKNNTPIEKTIVSCKDITRFITVRNVRGGAHKDGEYLGKTIRYYYAKDVYGTINYVTNGNKVPVTEGAKTCMDLPNEFPDDIDYDKYIEIAKGMLYDIGYLKRAEQVAFF